MIEPAANALLAEYKRREFFRQLGTGSLLTLPLPLAAQTGAAPLRLRRAAEGIIEAFTGKIDMGQGLQTLLVQAIAEELRVPVESIRLTMGDTALSPDDGGTWASLTSPETVPAVRKDAAAFAGHPLTSPADWRVLGLSVPPLQGHDVVTGALRYAGDVRAEGMLHAAIVRPDAYRARLESFDAAEASKIAGVQLVRDGNLLAALASDPHTATRAAALIAASWRADPLPSIDALIDAFPAHAVAPVEQNDARYPPLIRRGDLAAGFAAAATRRLTSTYRIPPITHAALEPRAAIAQWSASGSGSLTIWCGKQAPFLVRAEVARALGVPETKVRIVVHSPGGAFGGKQRGECEIEAAMLARAAGPGVPVRVAWTRDDEFWVAYGRPAGLVEVESGVDSSGRIVAWCFRNYNSGAPGLRPPYDIAHMSNEFWRAESPLRQGSYRALAATANNFARESHIDEWAHRLGRDPLEFRLANIADLRLREVLEKTADRFGWGKRKAGTGGVGHGLACNLEKNARLALMVETEGRGKALTIRRIAAIGDFGAALNPDNLRHQMQGAIVQGLGGALWERLEFDTRSQRTRRFAHYRVPRFSDILSSLSVDIIDRREIPPAGAGESSITLPAPALANAIFSATGDRRRSLPLAAP
jgi:nicotinate dehydrogenase subunit B